MWLNGIERLTPSLCKLQHAAVDAGGCPGRRTTTKRLKQRLVG